MLALLKYCKQEFNHDGWKITKDSRESVIRLCKNDNHETIDCGAVSYLMSDIIQGIFHVFWTCGNTVLYMYYQGEKFHKRAIAQVCYMYHNSNGIYLGDLSDRCNSKTLTTILRISADNDLIKTPLFENETDSWTITANTIFRNNKKSAQRYICAGGNDFACTFLNGKLLINVYAEGWYTRDLYGNWIDLVATCLVPKKDYYQILDTAYILPKIPIQPYYRAWFDGKYLYLQRLNSLDIYAYPSPENFSYLTDNAQQMILFYLWILKIHPTLKLYIPKRLLIEKILPLFIGEIGEK